MNEAEQIWANKLRFYAETSPRSGVPSGDVLDLPSGPAAVSREVEAWVGRLDVWRNPQPQRPAHQRHECRMTVSVGRAFLIWWLQQHTSVSGDTMNFDRRAPAPTFCLEVLTEKGDCFRILGMAVTEAQLTFEPMQVVNLDMTFDCLERRSLGGLTAATRSFSDPVIPSVVCGASWSFGAWGADPRVDNELKAYAATLYFTRRDLSACQYNPNGVPTRFTSCPWRIIAELRTPRTDLAAAAKDRAFGRLGIFIGPDGADIEFLTVATAYATTDPVKAWDHREEVLSVEMHPDAFASLLFVRDNYTSGP